MENVMYECPDCGGDGKETCHNPDHGLISALSFRDEGRLGCPVCGHSANAKVKRYKNGIWLQDDCDTCMGKGIVDEDTAMEFISEYDIDSPPKPIN